MFGFIKKLFREKNDKLSFVGKLEEEAGGDISYLERRTFTTSQKRIFEKQSKQIKDSENKWMYQHGLIGRPYSPEIFEDLYESCDAFFATVNQIATDVAGRGYTILLKENMPKNEVQKEKLETFFKRPNNRQSFRDICDLMLKDWGKIGFGAFEVVRNKIGEVSSIYPIKVSTLWIHESKEKFCQKIGQKMVWFKEYGLKDENGNDRHFSIETGEEGNYIGNDEANELIWFATQYGKSGYYPVPNILPAALDALSLRAIKSYNYSFFTNFSIPAMAVILTGRWKDGVEKKISTFLDVHIKGTENANKTLVVKAPKDGDAKFEPLIKNEREGSFRLYMQDLDDDIMSVYSMPPYRIGKSRIGKLGGSNIVKADEIYKDSVIEPLQGKLENIFNFMIIEQGLNVSSYYIKFEDIDTSDSVVVNEMYNSQIEHGTLAPNEVRKLQGREKYTEGDSFFISSNLKAIGEEGLNREDEEAMKLAYEMSKLREEIAHE